MLTQRKIHTHGGGWPGLYGMTEDTFRTTVKTHMRYGTTSIS